MKRDKRLAGTIHLDVFHIQIGVFRSADDLMGYYRDNLGFSPDITGGAAYGMARMDEDAEGESWWSLIITDEANISTKAHECVHIADFVMERLGIPCNCENTEVRAYMTGCMLSQLLEIVP